MHERITKERTKKQTTKKQTVQTNEDTKKRMIDILSTTQVVSFQ
jgi:hypothetical protein